MNLKALVMHMALMFLLLWSGISYAEDATQPVLSEAEESAAEDAIVADLPGEVESPLRGMNFKGVFNAQTTDGQPDLLGFFKNNDKSIQLVKADNDDVKKLLHQFDGKEITVYGKLRNKGKYLIVTNVLGEKDPPVNRRKKKGF